MIKSNNKFSFLLFCIFFVVFLVNSTLSSASEHSELSSEKKKLLEDFFVLRIGSDPTRVKYSYDNPKKDDSHDAYISGNYKRFMENVLNIPFKNVVHCTNNTPDRYFNVFSDEIVYAFADFRYSTFKREVLKTLPDGKLFDLIITDCKTTKFFDSKECFANVLSVLKKGGKLILTDVDERIESPTDYYLSKIMIPRQLKDKVHGFKLLKELLMRGFYEDEIDHFLEQGYPPAIEFANLIEEEKNTGLIKGVFFSQKSQKQATCSYTFVDTIFDNQLDKENKGRSEYPSKYERTLNFDENTKLTILFYENWRLYSTSDLCNDLENFLFRLGHPKKLLKNDFDGYIIVKYLSLEDMMKSKFVPDGRIVVIIKN